MKPSQVLHGFLGGILGFMFAIPLGMHTGWMEMVGAKVRHTGPRHDDFRPNVWAASIVVFPILFALSVLGSPLIAVASGYQCWKNDKLSPLTDLLLEPYRNVRDDEGRMNNFLSLGMLTGYTMAASFLGLAMIDFVTGGAIGLLAAPGYALAHLVFGSATTFSHLIVASLAMTYLSSFVGFCAGGLYAHFTDAPAPEAPVVQNGSDSEYHIMTSGSPAEVRNDYDVENANVNNNNFDSAPLIPKDPKTVEMQALSVTTGRVTPSPVPSSVSSYQDARLTQALAPANFSNLGEAAMQQAQAVGQRMTSAWNSLWDRRGQQNATGNRYQPVPSVETASVHSATSLADEITESDIPDSPVTVVDEIVLVPGLATEPPTAGATAQDKAKTTDSTVAFVL